MEWNDVVVIWKAGLLSSIPLRHGCTAMLSRLSQRPGLANWQCFPKCPLSSGSPTPDLPHSSVPKPGHHSIAVPPSSLCSSTSWLSGRRLTLSSCPSATTPLPSERCVRVSSKLLQQAEGASAYFICSMAVLAAPSLSNSTSIVKESFMNWTRRTPSGSAPQSEKASCVAQMISVHYSPLEIGVGVRDLRRPTSTSAVLVSWTRFSTRTPYR